MKTFIRTDRTLLPSLMELRFREVTKGMDMSPIPYEHAKNYYNNGSLFCVKIHNCMYIDEWFWDIFLIEFNMEYHKTQLFFCTQLEKHFNLKNITPYMGLF